MRQAVIAVQVLGHLAEGIEFGEQVALVVVARSPGAAVRIAGLGHQRGQVVIFVGGLAAQRVGLFEQAGEFVVLELQAVTVRQGQANHVALLVQFDGIAFATVVAAGDHAVVGVVLHFQLAAEHVGGPAGAAIEVVAEVVVLAVAGPVFDHARLVAQGLPAVVATFGADLCQCCQRGGALPMKDAISELTIYRDIGAFAPKYYLTCY
ncbi:hypothetical protein D3C76_766610 [compost metagenome]